LRKRNRKEYLRQYYLKNKEKALEERKIYYQLHKEDCLEYAKQYRIDNHDLILSNRSEYYKKNREKCLESSRNHRMNNQGRYNFYRKNRKLAKANRTPKWLTEADLNHIKCLYEAAERLTKCLGIEFEVDHIIPLRGKLVSGLHVPTNLQVITRAENNRKSNKFDIKI
jgi:hypothetical protein